MDEFNIDDISYEDLLDYAEKLSDEIMEFLPDSYKDSKENLILWISENEPDYDPEDKN